MPEPRVIPILLLKDRKLVKTKKYKNPHYIGDPLNAIKIFNEKKVDELFIFDIDKSQKNNQIDFEFIEGLAGECFFPLCYGGGIKSVEDAKTLFSIGVEKICIQSAVLENNNIIRKLRDIFGSQAIVVSLDIKRSFFGYYKLYHTKKRKILNINLHQFIQQIEAEGAGELLLSFVDREGSFQGADLKTFADLTTGLSIPVILSGGVGNSNHVIDAVKAGADGVAIGSKFVFYGPHNAVLISYFDDMTLEAIHETRSK